jgi:hypothetical protein
MRRLGLAGAALFVLAACGGAPTPIEPTAKASGSNAAPSADATSTLKPPTLPAAAKRNDATGAANFVAYWVKVSNYAARTGETGLLRQISDPDCVGCLRYISLYEETYKRGGSFEGGDNSLRDVAAESGPKGVYIMGTLDAAPGHYVVRRGAKRKVSPAESTKVTFLTRFSDDEWLMVDVGLAAS